MKTLAMLLLLAAPMLAHATDVHPGDSLADVQTALGAPNGQVQVDGKLILFYDRGQVQLTDGKVTRLDLLSPEAFAAQQAQQKADDAQAEQLRAQRIAKGEALKAKKLADPKFISEPPGDQLAFWQDFRLRYPEVSCDDEYATSLAHWQGQHPELAKQKQITEQQQQATAQQQTVAPPAPEQVAVQQSAQYPTNWETLIDNAYARASRPEADPRFYNGRFYNVDNDDRGARDNDNHRRAEYAEPRGNDRDDCPPQTTVPVTSSPLISIVNNSALIVTNPAGPAPNPPAPIKTNPAGPAPTLPSPFIPMQ